MTQREKQVEKIRAAKSELRTAGPLHKRDLQKHIARMERELKAYDMYRREA